MKVVSPYKLSDEEMLVTTTFIKQFETAQQARVEIGRVIIRVLKKILGEKGAQVVIYTIGKDSLDNSHSFADGILGVFGSGDQIILKRLLSESGRS